MHNDDQLVGRILTRREAMTLIGSGAALLLGCSAERGASAATSLSTLDSMCFVRPEQTEGPYFSDGQIQRSDIRQDPHTGRASAGLPLQLNFHLTRPVNGECSPLEGMKIDIWHCDASGRYSHFRREG